MSIQLLEHVNVNTENMHLGHPNPATASAVPSLAGSPKELVDLKYKIDGVIKQLQADPSNKDSRTQLDALLNKLDDREDELEKQGAPDNL